MKTPANYEQENGAFLKKIAGILRHWWLMLVTGLLLLGIGTWVLYHPFQSYLNLSCFFAIGMVITGLLDIIFALKNRQNRRWMWWLLAGIADIVVGIYLFNNTLITIVFLPLVIGLWTFYKGFMAIGDAFHIRTYKFGNWRRLLFTAAVALMMALLLMACPVIGVENIFLFSGLAFIAAGIFRIYLSLKLLAIEQKIRQTEA